MRNGDSKRERERERGRNWPGPLNISKLMLLLLLWLLLSSTANNLATLVYLAVKHFSALPENPHANGRRRKPRLVCMDMAKFFEGDFGAGAGRASQPGSKGELSSRGPSKRERERESDRLQKASRKISRKLLALSPSLSLSLSPSLPPSLPLPNGKETRARGAN